MNDKPRLVEEHDGWSGVFSAVSAGVGVALTSDAFNYAFDDRIKLVRLTPEPKRVAIGIITRKGKLGPAAEKFCQCAKEAFARFVRLGHGRTATPAACIEISSAGRLR